MNDQQPPPQPPPPPRPAWGAPPPQQPRQPNRRASTLISAIVILAVLAGVGIISSIVSSGDDNTTNGSPASTLPGENPAAQATEATEPPETTSAGPVTAKLDETLQFEDSFGSHAVDVTVTRKRISRGDEFSKPDNGVWVGLFVQVKAFKDGISVPQFYALVNGKHYDATCCMVEEWKPELSTASTLNKGEATEGWILLDVPSRTGKLVMQEFLSEKAQAIWTY